MGADPVREEDGTPSLGARARGGGRRTRVLRAAGGVLVAGGVTSLAVAAGAQVHAPQPGAAQAGTLGPAAGPSGLLPPLRTARRPEATRARVDRRAAPAVSRGPIVARSVPVSIDIATIGVDSRLQELGLDPNGTVQVPPLDASPLTNEAGWYRYSPTPGSLGPALILGHVDSAAQGPSVFFRLGDLRPGEHVDVTLRDGTVTVFRVDGVREYAKARFPTRAVYGNLDYAGLRLVTCGGSFDYSTHHYLSNIVVYASLVSSHPTRSR